MPDLREAFTGSRKNFIIIGHRARTDALFSLDDLPGTGGRWDGLARCVSASILLSHGVRKDTSVHLVLEGPPDPPKIISVSGGRAKYMNPDERSMVAYLRRGLDTPLPKRALMSVNVSPGVFVTRGGLADVMDLVFTRGFVLDENGNSACDLPFWRDTAMKGEPLAFYLSDDTDLMEEERSLLKGKGSTFISLGPKVLHAYQAIVLMHSILDRAEQGI